MWHWLSQRWQTAGSVCFKVKDKWSLGDSDCTLTGSMFHISHNKDWFIRSLLTSFFFFFLNTADVFLSYGGIADLIEVLQPSTSFDKFPVQMDITSDMNSAFFFLLFLLFFPSNSAHRDLCLLGHFTTSLSSFVLCIFKFSISRKFYFSRCFHVNTTRDMWMIIVIFYATTCHKSATRVVWFL